MSAVASSAAGSQGHNARQSARQTRTNPSRTSKTLGRSSFAYGHGSMMDQISPPPVPHGFYPALTHFTDAITALPREFRRHNSLLKEVDAKAWALEENLLQLLKASSESQSAPYPSNPAPVIGGVIREDLLPTDISRTPESPESKSRRVLFDRVRHTLSDLMLTADEKNHVISNANDELDRQIMRLDSIFPFIAGEISEEARLGSLNHWAYSNRNAPKTTTSERPRREAASNKDLVHALQEAEAASRSEARREAVLARRRRAHADSDLEEARAAGTRKGQSNKNRIPADHGSLGHSQSATGSSGQAKRRKVERPANVEAGAAMERSASGAGASVRGGAKEATDVVKKRPRAPNTNAAARKRNNTGASTADSPVLGASPLIGAATAAAIPRSAASPGPGVSRPQSSRAQQNVTQANARQRPSSSASNRVPSSGKITENKAPLKEAPSRTEMVSLPDNHRAPEPESMGTLKTAAPVGTLQDDTDRKPTESIEPSDAPISASIAAPKGRTSKTSTPVLPSADPVQPRSRPTRSTDSTAPKRTQKKNGANTVPVLPPPAPASDAEESLHEGDDEDEEGEPRYCYCNEISFGEMVACDNDACPREWFHLSCVGLTKPPGRNVKWYCNECKENMRRSRSGR